jgi:hypothetical protein
MWEMRPGLSARPLCLTGKGPNSQYGAACNLSHPLSFVDVRFIAYNKNPDNNRSAPHYLVPLSPVSTLPAIAITVSCG